MLNQEYNKRADAQYKEAWEKLKMLETAYPNSMLIKAWITAHKEGRLTYGVLQEIRERATKQSTQQRRLAQDIVKVVAEYMGDETLSPETVDAAMEDAKTDLFP